MNKAELLELKNECDNFYHCGDYGLFYLEKDKNKLHAVLGDSDGYPQEDDPEEVTSWAKFAKDIAHLVDETEMWAEFDPAYDEDTDEFLDNFLLLSHGTETYYSVIKDSIDIKHKPLNHGDQAIFNKYLESL